MQRLGIGGCGRLQLSGFPTANLDCREHIIASLGRTVQFDRTRLLHIRKAAEGSRALGVRVGSHGVSILRFRRDAPRRHRYRARGDSLLRPILTAVAD